MATEVPVTGGKSFGSCCRDMQDVLEAEDFDPLFYVGDDEVLYMTVGVIEGEDEEEGGFLDHPIYHCPFCGKQVQTPDEVDAKTGEDDEEA